MIPIYIEDNQYIVKKSRNLLETCLDLGFNIPYFCWHPSLGSIGSCRQCAVRCSNSNLDKGSGKLVMSCMTPIVENMYVYLFDKEVQEFRKGILELLMINHPHDCPVCEEGGNCHLQDMTVMTGHAYRRYRFAKRTHYNQNLGPLISHEMNRCITCYRCVRYYKDYAGGDDLNVFGVHNNIYFGRVRDGRLQNEFSGNLIEICPTGVFVDKTRPKNYTRKWDAIFAPSICQQCSVGCNIILGERYGKLCRVENRYNGNINGYFLCDRGRFGCDYVNLNSRPKKPVKKQYHNYIEINQTDAIQCAVKALQCSDRIIGIGSTRASIESNFALRKMVGEDNFYIGINDLEYRQLKLIFKILCSGGIYIPSVREIENYDAVLILGEDVTQTGARIALSVRQAIKSKSYAIALSKGIFSWQSESVSNIAQDIKYPLLITGTDKTKLDDLAKFTYYDSVQNQARFGFAIAHSLDPTAPVVDDFDSELNNKLKIVVQALIDSHKPLIISGSSSGSVELIESAFNIANALKNRGNEVGMIFVVNDVNSMGLAMIGNKSLDNALDRLCDNHHKKSFTSLIALENDLYRHVDSFKIEKSLNNVNYFIILDHQQNLINKKADLLLPTAAFSESNGTVINYEGRAQRFFRLYNPQHYNNDVVLLESWRWLYLINDCYRGYIRKKKLNIDYVIDSIVNCFPELIGIKNVAPDSTFRVCGQKIAQASHRYSGRTAMYSHINIHESPIPPNEETMFTSSMEGNHNDKLSNNQIAFVWFPGWNSPQAWNKFQNQIGGHLYPEDPGIRVIDQSLYDENNNKKKWFKNVPDTLVIDENSDNWLITAYWHLFGSDYTSQQSKYIQSCMLKPYAMINLSDAKRLNIQKNMFLKFRCSNKTFCLPVKWSSNLPVKHIGLPIGFPNIPLFLCGMYAYNVTGVLSLDV